MYLVSLIKLYLKKGLFQVMALFSIIWHCLKLFHKLFVGTGTAQWPCHIVQVFMHYIWDDAFEDSDCLDSPSSQFDGKLCITLHWGKQAIYDMYFSLLNPAHFRSYLVINDNTWRKVVDLYDLISVCRQHLLVSSGYCKFWNCNP